MVARALANRQQIYISCAGKRVPRLRRSSFLFSLTQGSYPWAREFRASRWLDGLHALPNQLLTSSLKDHLIVPPGPRPRRRPASAQSPEDHIAALAGRILPTADPRGRTAAQLRGGGP